MSWSKIFKTKVLLILLLVSGLLTLGIYMRQADMLSATKIKMLLDDLGLWALPGFLVLATLGGLVPIPGAVFIAASRLVFGPYLGFAAAYVGALLAVTAAFMLVRTAMSNPKREIKLPFKWAQKLLDEAEHRPLISVVLLRTVFGVSPPLNYGLGFTGLSARHYIGGSAIGLIGPVAFVTFAVGLF